MYLCSPFYIPLNQGASSPRDSIPKMASDDLDLKERLGEGGFGQVWLAKYNYGMEVAVKIISEEGLVHFISPIVQL